MEIIFGGIIFGLVIGLCCEFAVIHKLKKDAEKNKIGFLNVFEDGSDSSIYMYLQIKDKNVLNKLENGKIISLEIKRVNINSKDLAK